MSEFFPKEETLNFPNSLITSDSSNSIIYNPSNMVEYDENFEILLNNPFFTGFSRNYAG